MIACKESKLKIDERKLAETRRRFLKEIEIHPKSSVLVWPIPVPPESQPIRRRMTTLHEGDVLYLRRWNFWVRAGVHALSNDAAFFPDFENPAPRIFDLLAAIGVSPAPSSGEEHIWQKIAQTWHWLGEHVHYPAPDEPQVETSHPAWPSIDDYAAYYQAHGALVWLACFSKAHLFASILGRAGIPRWRIAVAESHHTAGGAPPTATHVFVAVYVAQQWFYLDPTCVYAVPELPDFGDRTSVGLLDTVDYPHPYETISIPLAGFDRVPYLGED